MMDKGAAREVYFKQLREIKSRCDEAIEADLAPGEFFMTELALLAAKIEAVVSVLPERGQGLPVITYD